VVAVMFGRVMGGATAALGTSLADSFEGCVGSSFGTIGRCVVLEANFFKGRKRIFQNRAKKQTIGAYHLFVALISLGTMYKKQDQQ
jgi:hypothetical protein